MPYALIRLITKLCIILLCSSCGKAYFPLELKTVERDVRQKGQQDVAVDIVSLTDKSSVNANKSPYVRKVVLSEDPSKPAKVITAEKAIYEKLPVENDPGPYRIGVGDILEFSRFLKAGEPEPTLTSRKIIVSDDGYINLYEVGKIRAAGLSQSELEDVVYKKLTQNGQRPNFELAIIGFKSKTVFLAVDNVGLKTIPYSATPIFLENFLAEANLKFDPTFDSKIVIKRQNDQYIFSLNNLINAPKSLYRLFPGDKVFVKPLNYKQETVLLVGETGMQKSMPLSYSGRLTLADIVFSGGALNTVTSDFSQIYTIRKSRKTYIAYHLDITNPARANLASNFEMRPDDVVFVATQPLSLYARTLSQILGSTGLTLQARDTIRNEIGN